LKSGPFNISDAVSISKLEDAFRQGYWAEFVYPMDVAVLHLPIMTVDEDSERAITNGRPLDLVTGGNVSPGLCRAYSRDGRFIALLRYDAERGHWKPEKVFKN
jgi:tRNA pseudouridine55 synthase